MGVPTATIITGVLTAIELLTEIVKAASSNTTMAEDEINDILRRGENALEETRRKLAERKSLEE